MTAYHGRADASGSDCAARLWRRPPQEAGIRCGSGPKGAARVNRPGLFLAGGPAPTASLCPAVPAFPPRIPCLDFQLFPRDFLKLALSFHC